jgi:predicted thioesterase
MESLCISTLKRQYDSHQITVVYFICIKHYCSAKMGEDLFRADGIVYVHFIIPQQLNEMQQEFNLFTSTFFKH